MVESDKDRQACSRNAFYLLSTGEGIGTPPNCKSIRFARTDILKKGRRPKPLPINWSTSLSEQFVRGGSVSGKNRSSRIEGWRHEADRHRQGPRSAGRRYTACSLVREMLVRATTCRERTRPGTGCPPQEHRG